MAVNYFVLVPNVLIRYRRSGQGRREGSILIEEIQFPSTLRSSEDQVVLAQSVEGDTWLVEGDDQGKLQLIGERETRLGFRPH
jgi:hypothetical protein